MSSELGVHNQMSFVDLDELLIIMNKTPSLKVINFKNVPSSVQDHPSRCLYLSYFDFWMRKQFKICRLVNRLFEDMSGTCNIVVTSARIKINYFT